MSGIEKVATLTIAVKDQEEALRWFTEKLAFEKRMDLAAPGMRWLTIAPRKQKESAQLPGQIRAWFSSD